MRDSLSMAIGASQPRFGLRRCARFQTAGADSDCCLPCKAGKRTTAADDESSKRHGRSALAMCA